MITFTNVPSGDYVIVVSNANGVGCSDTGEIISITGESCACSLMLTGTDSSCNGANDGIVTVV